MQETWPDEQVSASLYEVNQHYGKNRNVAPHPHKHNVKTYHFPAVTAKRVKRPSGWPLPGESRIGFNSARSFSTTYGGEKRPLFSLWDYTWQLPASGLQSKQKINKMRLLYIPRDPDLCKVRCAQHVLALWFVFPLGNEDKARRDPPDTM